MANTIKQILCAKPEYVYTNDTWNQIASLHGSAQRNPLDGYKNYTSLASKIVFRFSLNNIRDKKFIIICELGGR